MHRLLKDDQGLSCIYSPYRRILLLFVIRYQECKFESLKHYCEFARYYTYSKSSRNNIANVATPSSNDILSVAIRAVQGQLDRSPLLKKPQNYFIERITEKKYFFFWIWFYFTESYFISIFFLTWLWRVRRCHVKKNVYFLFSSDDRIEKCRLNSNFDSQVKIDDSWGGNRFSQFVRTIF